MTRQSSRYLSWLLFVSSSTVPPSLFSLFIIHYIFLISLARLVLMQFRTASMSAMLAITKHGVCVGIIAPCLVNFIMADMEVVQNCISAGTFLVIHCQEMEVWSYLTGPHW